MTLERMKNKVRKYTRSLPVELFLLPSLSGFLLFFLAPFIMGLRYVFMDTPVKGRFVGLKNLVGLFGNEAFLIAVKNTILFMMPAVFLGILFPLILALLIKNMGFMPKTLRMLFVAPMAVPAATVALFWQIFFDVNGPMNRILTNMGTEPVEWLNGAAGIIVVIAVFVWKNVGYNMIILIVGLNNIPADYYESAEIEGAGPIRKFTSITLPGLVPTGFFLFTISIVNCFKVFREIYLIFGQYPNANVYMLQNFMNNMFLQLNYSKLTSAAYITAGFITLFLLVVYKFERKATNSFYL